jgi:hypothetical protein
MHMAQNEIVRGGWARLAADAEDRTFATDLLPQARAIIDSFHATRRTLAYQLAMRKAGTIGKFLGAQTTPTVFSKQTLLFEAAGGPQGFTRISSLLSSNHPIKYYSRNEELRDSLDKVRQGVADIGNRVLEHLGIDRILPVEQSAQGDIVAASIVYYPARKQPHKGSEEETAKLAHRDTDVRGGVATTYLSESSRYTRLGHRDVYSEVTQDTGDVIWMENRVGRTINDGPLHGFDVLSTVEPSIAVLLVAGSYEAAERFDHLLT